MDKLDMGNGYWIKGMNNIVCSECDRYIHITNNDTVDYYIKQFKYCPYCGSRMNEKPKDGDGE